jgi:hypothetical protein
MSIVAVSEGEAPCTFLDEQVQTFTVTEGLPSIALITNILVASPRVVVNLIENHMTAAYLTAMLKDLSVSYTGSDARVFLLTSTPKKVHAALAMEEIPTADEAGKEIYPLIIIGNSTKNRVIFKVAPPTFSTREAIENYARRAFTILEMQGYAYMTFTIQEDVPCIVDVSAALPKVVEVLQSRFDCDVRQTMLDIVEGAYKAGRSLV